MVKNIYALTPLQEGMFFHSLHKKDDTSPYFEQMDFEINGDFDIDIFIQSWDVLIARYDVFRTIFVYKNTPSPKQVVLKKGKIDLVYEDISTLGNQLDYISDYIEKSKKAYFKLSKKVPLRVQIFGLDEDKYRVIFAFHHILMDGWSGGIVFSELFSIYNSLKNSSPINLSPTKPYSQYIKWLQGQDMSKSRAFWQEYLSDYNSDSSLGEVSSSEGYKFGKSLFDIDRDKTRKLNRIVKENAITLNTLMQTIWGLVVAKMTKQQDIVFGATVSGRVDEIDGIEKMVGLFINAIPIRVKFDDGDTLLDIVKRVMNSSIEAQNHHYYSLADIQNLTPMKDNLIKQLLVFENYPSSDTDSLDIGFSVSGLEVFNQTNYDFDITIIPSDSLNVMFKYNSLIYPDKMVKDIQSNFLEFVDLYIDEPNTQAGSIITSSTKTVFVSSSFTHDMIEDSFLYWSKRFDMDLKLSFSGYNQVIQDLLDLGSPLYRDSGINLLLIRFEDVLRFLDLKSLDEKIETIEKNFEKTLSILKSANFSIPTFLGVFTPIKNDLSPTLVELYEKMATTLKDKNNIYLVDFRELDRLYMVDKVFDAHTDKIGHIPFSDDYFWAMGTYISRQIHALLNPHFKVIALDCDNTLWRGVVGEDKALGVGVKDGFLDLQKFVIDREKEGFLVVLNSKNNEADVWEVFEKNSNMLLQKEHIVHSKINWQPKSQNLKEMANELNLGLNSFIFLDDNPLECAEVIANAPEVLSLVLPKNSASFKNFLNHIWALDKIKVTKEDKNRTQMYRADRQRVQDNSKLSLDEFLSSLELKIYMNQMLPSQLARVSQLTQRTNQFNVSTIRRDENGITSLISKGSVCWSINVEDKFGSYGLVGVVITTNINEMMVIDTFLMSCRVLGRGVEKSILAGLKRHAKENGINRVEMLFIPTAKNRPALNFIEESNFNRLENEASASPSDAVKYEMSVDDLPVVDSFVDFYFDKGITTLKDESISDDKEIVLDTIIEEKKAFIDDFKFDLLETLPKEDIENIVHKRFYEPLAYHKGSDRVKLMAFNIDKSKEYIAPTNENQKKLVSIYQELLNITPIGVSDNFFDLGGHSLLATRVLSRVHQAFKISLTLKDLFDNPTISQLEKLLNGGEVTNTEIVKAPKMAYYPLSMMQKRVWLIDQMGGGVAYNMPIAIEVLGELNVKKLSSVFHTITQRHEILRTKIVTIEAEPMQEIQSSLDIDIVVQKSNKKETLADIERDSQRVFDLAELPLFRVKVYKLKKDRFVIYFNMNHIIGDGWSMGVITKEITALYNNKDLPDLSLQYRDFSFWQNTRYSKDNEDRDYWYARLSQKIEPLEFPTDYPRFKEQTFNGASVRVDLSKHVESIEKFSREYSVTLFIFLVASVKAILARYTMQSDIVLGYPISGRDNIKLENQIGFYANTLILRDSVDFNSDFMTLVNQVRESLLEANAHQHYPFEKILEELNIDRDLSRSPLFDYSISLNGDDGGVLKLGEAEIKPFEFDFDMSQFDMSFNFVSYRDGLYLNLNYNTDLFTKESMSRFLGNIDRAITNVLKNPIQKIKEIGYLSKEEINREFRTKEFKDTSIIELFSKQLKESAHNIAMSYDTNQTTYKELDTKSNALAHYLKDNFDIQKGDRVALLLDRESSVIAILAILKLGACFVPINLSMPKDKIGYIIDDAEIRVLLTNDDIKRSHRYSKKSMSIKSDINLTAYIIYTSGTTGNPKGVEVSQRSLINLLHWYIDDFDINKETKALLMIPTSFDASIKNILAPLIVGAEIVISKEQFDPFYLLDMIKTNAITLINCVPSAFGALLDATVGDYKTLKSLKYLALGGEALDLSILRDYYLHSNIKLFNIYGPTEATDITTVYEVQRDDFDKSSVPIGRPITNSKVYLVDKFDNLLPKGAVGEIAIAGEGVAKGYINNTSLTSKSFIEIPKLGRVYKTGDLAKELSNGDIEFLGRVDDQIKIRGNRVELQEIEYHINSQKEVDSATVLLKDGRLIAYVKYNSEIDIREYLKDKLISYMIPSEFVPIEELPLTSNGKIDKKFLLNIEIKKIEYVQKELSSKQKSILSIFENLLGRELSIDDNFFEVGGNSLNGVKLISAINEKLDKELKLSYIFEYQVIREFINNLDDNQATKEYRIYNADKKEALFIFPALIESNDYTLTSQKLSNYLSNYKIYALNFILDEDRVEKYNSLIDSLESGEHIFLGYSSGGNLAYEVAKKSKNIKKLILLDSWKIKKEDKISQREAEIEFQRDNIEIDYPILNSYVEMLNSMNNNKKVNCDIDLISFKKEKKIDGMRQDWQNSTKREFRGHIGFGNHYNMLKNNYLHKNMKIVNKIIKGEKDEN